MVSAADFFGPAMAVLPAETPEAPLSVFIEIDSTGRDGAGRLTVISRPFFLFLEFATTGAWSIWQTHPIKAFATPLIHQAFILGPVDK